MNASDNFRDRALRFFPGGSNGEYGIPEGDAPVIESGRGCRVWDTGGREYLDMTMAWGAALVGHAHPKVLEAASAAAANGANFAAVTRSMADARFLRSSVTDMAFIAIMYIFTYIIASLLRGQSVRAIKSFMISLVPP